MKNEYIQKGLEILNIKKKSYIESQIAWMEVPMKHKEILELLNKMTIEEKIGQMVQITGDVFLSEDTNNVLTGPLKNLHL